jgi:hypothetical protein
MRLPLVTDEQGKQRPATAMKKEQHQCRFQTGPAAQGADRDKAIQ